MIAPALAVGWVLIAPLPAPHAGHYVQRFVSEDACYNKVDQLAWHKVPSYCRGERSDFTESRE